MRLTFDGKRFNFKGTYQQGIYPRQLGFQWDPTAKILWTTDRDAATLLRKCADSSAKAELGVYRSPELPGQQITSIHTCLKRLSAVCDGAEELDGQGFSKSDTALGKHLASKSILNSEQATRGLELVRLHKSQLPEPMLVAAGV